MYPNVTNDLASFFILRVEAVQLHVEQDPMGYLTCHLCYQDNVS